MAESLESLVLVVQVHSLQQAASKNKNEDWHGSDVRKTRNHIVKFCKIKQLQQYVHTSAMLKAAPLLECQAEW